LLKCEKFGSISKEVIDCPKTTPVKTSTPVIDTTTPYDETTTPYVETTTPGVETTTRSNFCTWHGFNYESGDVIGIVVIMDHCVILRCDDLGKVTNESIPCSSSTPTSKRVTTTEGTTTTPEGTTTTTPVTSSSTTDVFSTTSHVDTTLHSTIITSTFSNFCVWNGFYYDLGQVVGLVKIEDACFLITCDMDGNISKKPLPCPASTTKPLQPTTTSTDNCVINGTDFNKPAPDNKWTDGCNVCKCVDNQAQCSKFCPIKSCPVGQTLVTDVNSDECCYCTCSEPVCKYKGVIHQPGSFWNDGNCTSCSCDETNGVTCTDLRSECDVIKSCDLNTHSLRYIDSQCCPICEEKQTDECQPVVVNELITTEEGCVTETEVELSVCSGVCASTKALLQYPPYIQNNCRCCQPNETEQREVKVVCDSGLEKSIQVSVAKSCSCSMCGQ